MARKSQFILLHLFVLIFWPLSSFGAVDTTSIDEVYQKAFEKGDVLTDRDFETIDSFISTALGEMFTEEEFSEVVRLRIAISSRKGKVKPSQYSTSFISSAKKHLKSSFEEIADYERSVSIDQLEMNLVILVAELEDVSLSEFAFDKLDNESSVIRYWAVKSLTNRGVISQLNSSDGDKELAGMIAQQLVNVAEKETQAMILGLIVDFGGQVNIPQAKQLLLKTADIRMSLYENWTVDNELLDAMILKYLSAEMLSQPDSVKKSAAGQKFSQLYSYMMQRLILGADILNDDSFEQLGSAIVEVEQTVIEQLLGRAQSTIWKAVESENYTALEREESTLFGSATKAGQLAVLFDFDYGKNSAGVVMTAPKRLKEPPKIETAQELLEEE